jgi:hypothetical protein
MSFHRHIQIDSRRHVELRVDGIHVFEDRTKSITTWDRSIPSSKTEIVIPWEIPWEILDEINAKRP